MLLVTGITGHIGKYFLKENIKNKFQGPIRCIFRENSSTSMTDNSELNLEKVIGYLEDQEFMNQTMIGINTVVHIVSIFYSVTVMRAATKNNVKRAILAHTTGIYSKYKSALEEYKVIEQNIDMIIKENNSKIIFIFLIPTMIYGYINDRNMVVFIRMVDKLGLFSIIDQCRNLLQPFNGGDLGKAYYHALMKSDIMIGGYILFGEKLISMKFLLRMISQMLDMKTAFISVPLTLGVFMAKFFKIYSVGKFAYIKKVQRMGKDRNFSHESAAKDFYYKLMPLFVGLKLEIDGYFKRFNRNWGLMVK